MGRGVQGTPGRYAEDERDAAKDAGGALQMPPAHVVCLGLHGVSKPLGAA